MARIPSPIEEKVAAWSEAFLTEARCSGPKIDRLDQRILRLQKLWAGPVDPAWGRGEADDVRWQANGKLRRYRRSHSEEGAKRDEEHALEKGILGQEPKEQVQCFGGRLIDGINAVPLCAFKQGKVEADLLLLVEEADGRGHRLFLVEAKTKSNNPWYAVVEHLRQLKLLEVSAVRRIFHRRNPLLRLPDDIPVTGLILAPASFYSSPGQKANAVEPARRLIAGLGIDVKLCIWDKVSREIRELGEAASQD